MAFKECPCYIGLRLPIGWLFSKIGSLSLKGAHLGRLACLVLGRVPIGAALAFASYLWGLTWPWLRALAMATLPTGVVLILAGWLCHGCFPMGAIMDLGTSMWACHGLGSVPTRASLALVACPLEGYFPKRRFFSQMR